ncbi:unnamed protein product [Ceratitis capitata]|uniref:(Mediterranean fruit fly) hypothetical protein n=1 Tax=Ceratitis capitata TaxID=7213 RepID=A0A811UPA2_CERCA|nr:unnamed protein product [Ceratitis capitata]
MSFNIYIIFLYFIGIFGGSLHARRFGTAQIGRKRYNIYNIKESNWFHAAHLCRSHNADLVTIESESEMNALSDYLNGYADKYFWTSGSDLVEEGEYMSLSKGRTLTYTNFFYEPDNYNNEDCIHIRSYKNKFYMNDLACNNTIYAICEQKLQLAKGCDNENCMITIPKHVLLEVIEPLWKSTNVLNYRE